MRLKSLTLQGYKSFATKTEFLFPTGITAIIGPNGSGKSNIADGILWALGEQSMRTLRGKSTVDMIFAGGHRRARAGMAEVSLTLDNADGWLPIEFTEVTISRRAYRSGENEYILNGSKVRLRDITALLGESSLAQRTYTVIGQGLVDAALSLRPQERRTLFEDAAGISHYRSQREDALQRLEETQHNLERVYDIIGEITPRLKRLERETEQVEEHRRLNAHLKRLQRTWYGYLWGQQQVALDRSLRIAKALKKRLDDRRRESKELDERLIQLRQQESELRAKLRDWHRESADLHDQTNEAQRELAVAEERARLLKIRRKELLAELGPLGEQMETQTDKVDQARDQVEQLKRKLAECRQRLAEVEQEWAIVKKESQRPARRRAEVEQELRARRNRLGQLNQALLDARQEVARLESEQAVAEERARQVQTRRDEILAELEPLAEQRDAQMKRVREARTQVDQMTQALAEHEAHLNELRRVWAAKRSQTQGPDPRRVEIEQTLKAHRAQVERLEQTIMDSRAEEARLTGEQKALNRILEEGSRYNIGVQSVSRANLKGILGPLATLIQVPPEWEQAIEAALGVDLQAVVVEHFAIVNQVRRVLQETGGRVTLLPLDSVQLAPPLPAEALCAADVVTCNERTRTAVEAVLGRVALCDDLSAAQALFPHMPAGSRCATKAGTVLCSDGTLIVGKVEVSSDSLLADERTRRKLPLQLDRIQRQRQEAEEQRRATIKQIAALEAQREVVDRQAAEAKERLVQAEREAVSQVQTQAAVAQESLRNQQATLRREEALLERLEAQMTTLQQQADELSTEHSAIITRLQELETERPSTRQGKIESAMEEPPLLKGHPRLAEARQRCRQIEEKQRAEAERIAALEGRLQALIQQAEATREEAAQIERETVGEARTEVAVAEEALRSQQATLQQAQNQSKQLQARIDARRRRVAELEEERVTLATRTEELRHETTEMEAQLLEVQARIRPAEEKLNHLRDEYGTTEKEERRIRDRMRDTETHLNRAQLDVERCRDELKLLARRIEEDLGLVELELSDSVTAQTPLPLRPLVSELPVVEELPAGLEEEIQRLKAHLRRLGSINPNAPEDYAEVQERHRFLTEQSADLEAASERLRQAVAELDQIMASAFQETFEAVSTEFVSMFKTLFDGGGAQLELTEPDDLLNTGVDIVARPPGKRAQRLALLSGGERALTAVALLFAILQICPAPFCVLDEVDAMLDEANVGRFRTVLQRLSEKTQFVIITHTRGTVEVADTIYGVSMGSDAVSQVVSLQLDEV